MDRGSWIVPHGSSWRFLAHPASSWLLLELAPPSSSWLIMAFPGSPWLLGDRPDSSWFCLVPPPWLLALCPHVPSWAHSLWAPDNRPLNGHICLTMHALRHTTHEPPEGSSMTIPAGRWFLIWCMSPLMPQISTANFTNTSIR